MKKIIIALLLTCFSGELYAASRWVSDTLYVPLRSGKGNQFRILHKGLISGTRLKLIEEDKAGGWSYVEAPNGEKGWVRNQFLQDEPTAGIRLQEALNTLNSLDKSGNELKLSVKNLTEENKRLSTELENLRQAKSKMEEELATIKQVSSGALELNQRHQALMEEHQLIQTKLDVIKAENSRLKSDDRNTFFLYGALAVLLGVILTLTVPNLRPKKRYSEWA